MEPFQTLIRLLSGLPMISCRWSWRSPRPGRSSAWWTRGSRRSPARRTSWTAWTTAALAAARRRLDASRRRRRGTSCCCSVSSRLQPPPPPTTMTAAASPPAAGSRTGRRGRGTWAAWPAAAAPRTGSSGTAGTPSPAAAASATSSLSSRSSPAKTHNPPSLFESSISFTCVCELRSILYGLLARELNCSMLMLLLLLLVKWQQAKQTGVYIALARGCVGGEERGRKVGLNRAFSRERHARGLA